MEIERTAELFVKIWNIPTVQKYLLGTTDKVFDRTSRSCIVRTVRRRCATLEAKVLSAIGATPTIAIGVIILPTVFLPMRRGVVIAPTGSVPIRR